MASMNTTASSLHITTRTKNDNMTATRTRELMFWRNLTPYATPHRKPTASSPHALVVGAGVTGLVTAWVLLDHGYRVTIIAKEWASYGQGQRLTSQIAGALWEYPPAVCGQHTDTISLQNSKKWCMVAYRIWDAIAASQSLAQAAGVRMKIANFFFPKPMEQDEEQMSKMREIMASGIRGFRRDPAIIQERRIGEECGMVDAYEHLAPVIDTDTCMKFLKGLVSSKGAKLVTRTIEGDLLEQEVSLREEYNADVIVNASGLAGTELAADNSCYPIRGAMLRVLNDGNDFPKLDQALSVSAQAVLGSNEFLLLVPRNDNILLLGGISEPHEHKLDFTLESPTIRRMRERCEAFFPDLRRARLDPGYPLAQGLRPFHQRNVRVERELRRHQVGTTGREQGRVSRIIHNYGHGGSGWSLSFGCAAEVLGLVEEALVDLPPKSMALRGCSPGGEALRGKL